jgi:outer membrane cobalamin receptor
MITGSSVMKRWMVIFILTATPLFAQTNTGELRLKVVDPQGLAAKTSVELRCDANQYQSVFSSDESGEIRAKRLPYGLYKIRIEKAGFIAVSDSVEIRSALPTERTIQLALASANSSIQVNETETLIDPDAAGAVNRVGTETIQERTSSLPGRSLQDLVNAQPGWLYEGNAVLHPRGSEYQTQVVVDGIPLTDNRSPSFGPEIEADDIDSLSVYTAGFPAEYGRKMGGVIELNTLKDTQQGVHGQVVLSGGSFDSAGAFASVQFASGKNIFGVSGSGDATSHYLNPVVPQNFTNTGTTGDYSARYERDITPNDRLSLSVRHEFSRYEIPNEQVQQAAGQLQNGANSETMGIISYQHIFSPNVIGDFRGMVRDSANDLISNPLSTPIIAFQNNSFREGYFKGSISVHHGRHEFKAGVESDNIFLHERFNDEITDPTQFDDDTPPTYSFAGKGADLEQSVYVQDLIHLGAWNVSAGLRWDHYQLLVNEQAFSPRISVSRFFSSANLVVHASYDSIFQTPSSANILISSSASIVSLSPEVLRLPVKPSHGDYFEFGASKSFFGKFRLDANAYRRQANNYADDDQLLSTAVSFPISFRHADIYGGEAKIEIPDWHKFSGFVSYSYLLGRASLPVTGGLFLGDDAEDAASQLSGKFPISQDQRNTVRVRIKYQLFPRLWFAGGLESDSGLPFEFTGTEEEALAESGQRVIDRINFDRGRVRPSLSVNASIGAEIYKSDSLRVRLQGDARNLNNRLNVIDFGGLFSGNAIGPPRSYFVRLTTSF